MTQQRSPDAAVIERANDRGGLEGLAAARRVRAKLCTGLQYGRVAIISSTCDYRHVVLQQMCQSRRKNGSICSEIQKHLRVQTTRAHTLVGTNEMPSVLFFGSSFADSWKSLSAEVYQTGPTRGHAV
ncbi:hypothetical protein EVAR_67010_1 [Eumeta japonica]|uniref:Uncharacterized protein n=1 Tax=Eumeta variegata TaxID=151549 RepID=A0A4C1ZPB7_EUMVA|nr:hypothetical protein EVAR_67010_1 [Eumeta japonica]